MNFLFEKIRDKHALWYKGIVFVICVLLTTYLLPKQKNVSVTQLKVGEAWLNEDLIAEVDFLIKKTDIELQEEKEKRKLQNLYFIKIPTSAEAIKPLQGRLSSDEQKKLNQILNGIYNNGIISEEFLKTEKTDSVIYLVENNTVFKINKTKLYTKQRVKNILEENDFSSDVISLIESELHETIIYDETLSKELFNQDAETNTYFKSKINAGTELIKKNDLITAAILNTIESYYEELNKEFKHQHTSVIIIGQIIISTLIFGIMMLFLAFFRKNIFSQNTHITFILLITLLIIIASSIVQNYNVRYLYAVPYCLIPILIRVFFDSRTALFNFLTIILICSFFCEDKFEFVFIQLIAGIGTIFSVADVGKRSKLFVSAMLALLFYISSYVSYHLVKDGGIILSNLESYVPFLISSLFVLFSFPLIYVFEKLFGFTSDFTLLELCDLNYPLLRQLSQKVPGTFQHSLQVANLAEEACYKIGGNALLVRAGAMFHDIGKMTNPRFFTENQVGEVSPHEDLSAKESAKIIISHVINGVELAKANKLPEAIIDFIRTHHGTTTTRYFLYNYKKEHENEVVNEDLFRYPGPIPFSKETAILMMADGVEAASRSLKKYDAVAIDELVDKIINHQINENQFINADITYRDINQIKKIFKKRLMNIYHVRIEYPR